MISRHIHLVNALKAVSLSLIMVGGSLAPAHAFFDFKKWFSFGNAAPVRNHNQTALDGMKTKSFVLHQAQVTDIEPPMQRYLDGIKSQGFLIVDSVKNTLVVTDFPENLDRVERLILEMDIGYDNPNSAARQMLAMQQMMKAIRLIGAAPSATSRVLFARGTSSAPPAVSPVGVPSMPSNFIPPPVDPESEKKFKILEDRPTISGFRVLGWIKDRHGAIVVLATQDQQRYIFRDGRLMVGRSFSNTSPLDGIRGHIVNEHLILEDVHQGTVSLSMVPHDSDDARRIPR